MKLPILLASLVALASCAAPTPRRVPLGDTFPSVHGESLEGVRVDLPADLAGEPAVLLVGYEMDAQFDIDRWLLGLIQLGTPVQLFELPTIDGMIPGMIAGTIDEGMRGGIRPEDWASVVTLYGAQAEAVVALTGDERGQNARVLLLDSTGTIVWFADRGWSATQLVELDARARALVEDAPQPTTGPSTMTETNMLFDFRDPATAERFSAVDDRVMGGVSRSTMRARDGVGLFSGELSTERNGGFASVRATASADTLGIDDGAAGVALHVRGDGRTYQARLRTDDAFDGPSYRASFATTAGAWTTIHLPFELFRATFRGQEVPGAPELTPARVRGFGLLVADGQVGSFELELAWIRAY